MERSREAARGLVLEPARAVLRDAGLELTSDCFSSLARASCVIAPRVEDALRHWISQDASQVWAVDGQIAPLGDRRSRFGKPQPESGPHCPVLSPVEWHAADSQPRTRVKKSTGRGEGRLKLIAALSKHHRYAEGGALHQEPVGNNEIARMADVDKATASNFFKKDFGGYRKYMALCRDASRLFTALKLLNGEYRPRELNGRHSDTDDRPEDD